MLTASELSITQKKVLIVLGKHEGEYLTTRKISQEGGVNTNHVKQAIYKFRENDMVYINSLDFPESVTITPDGMDIYNDSI